MSEIKPGDVVQLNSGGPEMTVKSVSMYDGGKGALCQWFPALDAKPSEWTFLLSSLVIVPQE